MKQDAFFSQLRREFQNDPYRDRFLAELEDHAEDLAEAQNIAPKSLNSGFMQKHFGEPSQIKETFHRIVRPWDKLFFVLEGLFYGFLMLPLSFVFTHSLQNFLLRDFADLGMLGAPFLWLFFYGLAFYRYRKFELGLRRPWLLWLALIAGPSLIHAGLFFWDAGSLAASVYPESQTSYMFPPAILKALAAFIGINAVAAVTGWLLSGISSSKKTASSAILIAFFKKAIFVYFALFIALRTGGTYLGFPAILSSGIAVLYYPFAPLFFAEYLSGFFFSSIFGSQSQANLLFSLYIPAMVLIFLGLQSLVALLRQKNWRSPRLLVLAYVVSLGFLTPRPFELHPDYALPALPVSRLAEKRQASILYPAMKYFNQDEGTLFHYQIGYDSAHAQLYFRQNTGQTFYLNPQAWAEGRPEALFGASALSAGNNPPRLAEAGEYAVRNGFKAHLLCEGAPEADFSASSWQLCPKIKFKGRALSDSPLDVKDIAFSPDGRWLLLLLSTGAYNPQEVHLLDLRNLS